MSDLVISLTAIPPRLPYILPTLQDLMSQDIKVAEIRLNLPVRYRRFPGIEITVPKLPPKVNVVRVPEDCGPATKVLPTAQALLGQDVEILFCDDDQHYDRHWARRMITARHQHPTACIVENGYDLPHPRPSRLMPRARPRQKDWKYRLARLRRGFRTKPSPYLESGFVDVFQGYRGAMIRPESLPSAAFDVPDILWTVDDIWLSGQLTQAGVPIWLTTGSNGFPKAPKTQYINPLQQYSYRAHDRRRAEAACIAYFQSTYGIWQGV